MEQTTIEKVLAYCVAHPDAGAKQLLDKFPEYRTELTPLLALDRHMTIAMRLALSPARRSAIKRRWLRAVAAYMASKV